MGVETFDAARSPLGMTPYEMRDKFFDGTESQPVRCSGKRFQARPGEGRYYTLVRSTDSDMEAEAIEVYLVHKWGLSNTKKWSLYYQAPAEATFVRLSTDGENFQTIEFDYKTRESLTFTHGGGNMLVLKFGDATGSEVEYRSRVDYARHDFIVLGKSLFEDGELSCATELDGEIRHLVRFQGKPPAAYCGLRSVSDRQILSGFFSVAKMTPVVSSVRFGCHRNRLPHEDAFEEQRKASKPGWTPLIFSVPEKCDTVYAQFMLLDGSLSEILVTPVLTDAG